MLGTDWLPACLGPAITGVSLAQRPDPDCLGPVTVASSQESVIKVPGQQLREPSPRLLSLLLPYASRRASVIDPRRLTHLAQLAVARRASSSHLAHSSKASALPAHTSSCLYTFSADGDSLLSSKPCPTSTASYFIYPSGA